MKKLLFIAVAAGVAALASKKARQEKQEQALWAEATDDVAKS
jgi:hypothetical protein